MEPAPKIDSFIKETTSGTEEHNQAIAAYCRALRHWRIIGGRTNCPDPQESDTDEFLYGVSRNDPLVTKMRSLGHI